VRYIPLLEKQPNADWIAKADVLLQELVDAPDMQTRKQLIDNNTELWGELKTWLLELSHGKCWFSEAKDCFNHWDVEHYRPKKSAKDLDSTETDGYWWLAFDWKNFRICGNAGNRKKGTFFPLRPGTNRIPYGGDIRYEDPMLLDPIDEDDPNLLSFDLEGHAIPSVGAKTQWEKDRVRYSVERFKLDFGPLEIARKTVWTDCFRHIREYLDDLNLYQANPDNVIAKDRYKRAAKEIRKMIKEDQQFSAVARACVLSMNIERVACLLTN
jgi:hypothetical protein